MWSAVPDVEDLSSGSGSDGDKSANSEDETSHGARNPETSNAPFDSTVMTVTAPPSGVSEQHWQTFCKLKRRRDDLSKSQSQGRPKRRRKKLKTDQKDVSSEAALPSSSSSSSSRTTLKSAKREPTVEDRLSSKPLVDTESPLSPGPSKRSAPSQEQQKHWDTLKKHLQVNEHIHQGIDHGQYNPHKSGLEKQLDKAVEEGEFDQAEELSNQLATRDLACKIAKSADARDYLKWKESEETRRTARRKKEKLNWGFEAKERWQMKGNM